MKKLFTLVALPLLVAPAGAAVILSSGFTGVVANDSAAPYTATGITWTTSNLTLAGNDLEITGPTTGNAFITAGTAADNIQVNRNVETAGSWSATITFSPTSDLDLTSFNLFYRAISGAGTNQNASKDALVTVSIYQGTGTGGALLGSANDVVTDAGNGAAGDTAVVDLSSLANLTSGQAYTLQFTTASNTSTGGNNWAIDDLSLSANVAAIPEPSVALLGGLGLIGLLRRRR